MHENEIVTKILDASFLIHRRYRNGLLESVYQRLLAYHLTNLGLQVETQKPYNLFENNLDFGKAFYADMVVNDKVIVELKAVTEIEDQHARQLRTYLQISGKKLGLLLNFGSPLLKEGISRVINGTLPPPPS